MIVVSTGLFASPDQKKKKKKKGLEIIAYVT